MQGRAQKVGMARRSMAFRVVKGSRSRRSHSPSRDARLPLPDSPTLLAFAPARTPVLIKKRKPQLDIPLFASAKHIWGPKHTHQGVPGPEHSEPNTAHAETASRKVTASCLCHAPQPSRSLACGQACSRRHAGWCGQI